MESATSISLSRCSSLQTHSGAAGHPFSVVYELQSVLPTLPACVGSGYFDFVGSGRYEVKDTCTYSICLLSHDFGGTLLRGTAEHGLPSHRQERHALRHEACPERPCHWSYIPSTRQVCSQLRGKKVVRIIAIVDQNMICAVQRDPSSTWRSSLYHPCLPRDARRASWCIPLTISSTCLLATMANEGALGSEFRAGGEGITPIVHPCCDLCPRHAAASV